MTAKNTEMPMMKPLIHNTMSAERLATCITVAKHALEDLKAKNITILDVAELTDVMEHIIIAEGTSTRHVRAVAENVSVKAKQAGFMPIGMEGQNGTDWTLIDLGAVVVHVMMPQARAFYDLEGLWQTQGKKLA